MNVPGKPALRTVTRRERIAKLPRQRTSSGFSPNGYGLRAGRNPGCWASHGNDGGSLKCGILASTMALIADAGGRTTGYGNAGTIPITSPHWSNQGMFFNKLENFRKKQKGFWLMFSQCCGQCGGRGFLENILTDVTAVRQGGKSGDYTPDILPERWDKAPIWLEFTQPEPPSVQKLAYCAAHGIDVFESDGEQRPVDSVVIKAHIAPRNCRDRKRKRLMNIWENMRRTEHPVISIREHMRSPERKQREFEARWAEMEAEREAVAAGDVHSARCDNVFTLMEGSGMSLSYLTIHQPEGQCGAVPFCDDCFFQVMGGHDRTFPEDAARWGLNNDCPKCQDFLVQEESYAGPQRESVEMPATIRRTLGG